MKTIAILTILASTVTTIATASKYNAVCIFDELKCGGSIQLREYTPDTTNNCESGDCAAITTPGATTFSVLPTCTDDHLADTEKHLKGKPYVIVENYATSGCTGDFTKAVAVVASGKCYPSRAGEMSYKVTMGTNDLSVQWMQYSGSNCSSNATEMSFTANQVDRKSCVQSTMKVLAVKPRSTSSNSDKATVSPSPTTSGASSIGIYSTMGAGLLTTSMMMIM